MINLFVKWCFWNIILYFINLLLIKCMEVERKNLLLDFMMFNWIKFFFLCVYWLRIVLKKWFFWEIIIKLLLSSGFRFCIVVEFRVKFIFVEIEKVYNWICFIIKFIFGICVVCVENIFIRNLLECYGSVSVCSFFVNVYIVYGKISLFILLC